MGKNFAQIHKSHLSTIRMPPPHDLFRHQAEADIVLSSMVYIIQPLCQALSSDPELRGLNVRAEEDVSGAKTRSVLVFYKGDKPFLVLVHLRRGAIVKSDFKTAHVPRSRNSIAFIKDRYYTGNAYHIMQRASGYAMKHRAQHVVAFDWDHLALVHFGKFNHEEPDLFTALLDGVGNYCDIGLFRRHEKDKHLLTRLAGFLMDAHKNVSWGMDDLIHLDELREMEGIWSDDDDNDRGEEGENSTTPR